MQYRKLGRTGFEVSEIGLGTWAFASGAYGDVDTADALHAIDAAIDLGVNFFDTAPLYGNAKEDGVSETILGKGLAGKRDKVLVSTKFGRNPTEGCAPNFHATRARESVDASLQRMGTDRIDVLFFHSPFSPEEIHDDVWEALADLKQAGKVRAVGHSISMFQDTQGMARDWAAERKIDVIQVVLSLMNRESAQLIADIGGKDGAGVVARESLANGFLSGAVTRDTVFPENNLNSRYTREEIAERVDYVDQYRYLLRDEVKTMPQAALRWVLDNPHVSLVLTGARNQAELADCAAASDAPGFSAGELAKADALHTTDYSAA